MGRSHAHLVLLCGVAVLGIACWVVFDKRKKKVVGGGGSLEGLLDVEQLVDEVAAKVHEGEGEGRSMAVTGGRVAEHLVKFEAGTWKFLSSAYLMSLPSHQPLPECRTLADAGVLKTIRATDEELLLGEVFEDTLIISHRWESPEHPDPKCTKLKILQDHLRANPKFKSIWFDYPCLPQGSKSPEEAAFFDYCLKAVNLLYLAGNVLVFVDGQYNTRFWTQFEFFCATHIGSKRGLVPKSTAEFNRRVTMYSIGSSKSSEGNESQKPERVG